MLNLLCSSSFKWVADWRFYLALGIIATLAIMWVTIIVARKKLDRNVLKPIAFASVVTILLYSVAVGLHGFITEVKENGFEEKSQIIVACVILILIIAAVVLTALLNKKMRNKNNTIALVYAAICIAMSFALSYVRIFKLPQGGSITLASLLPIAIYSFMFGPVRGIICCFIYGLLQSLQDPFIVHVAQFFLDYPLAFVFIGLSGVFKKLMKPQYALPLGMIIGGVVRYLCHMFSGALFFGEYAADGFSPWAWGALYNSFVFADLLIAMIAGFFIMQSKQLLRQMRGVENKYNDDITENVDIPENKE